MKTKLIFWLLVLGLAVTVMLVGQNQFGPIGSGGGTNSGGGGNATNALLVNLISNTNNGYTNVTGGNAITVTNTGSQLIVAFNDFVSTDGAVPFMANGKFGYSSVLLNFDTFTGLLKVPGLTVGNQPSTFSNDVIATGGQFAGNGAGLTNLNNLNNASNTGTFTTSGVLGSGTNGGETFYASNGVNSFSIAAPNLIQTNNTILGPTNAQGGLAVLGPSGTGTNQIYALTGTAGQIPTFKSDGTVTASNAPSASQTPISQDVDYAGFAATNVGKMGFGAPADPGIQNPSMVYKGTNNAGQAVLFRVRYTNQAWTVDQSINGAAYTPDIFRLTTSGTLVLSGSLQAGADLQAAAGSGLLWSARSSIYSGADGMIQLYNNGLSSFGVLKFGGTTAAFPGLGRTNGDLVVLGGDGLFAGGDTNRLLVHGGLVVGPPGTAGTLTNTLYASATLDFPSTAAGAVSDLPITVAGAADGDIVAVGVPSAQLTGLTGDYFGWASNGVVYVRFANNNLVSAQDPASGTFKVRVDKFK